MAACLQRRDQKRAFIHIGIQERDAENSYIPEAETRVIAFLLENDWKYCLGK